MKHRNWSNSPNFDVPVFVCSTIVMSASAPSDRATVFDTQSILTLKEVETVRSAVVDSVTGWEKDATLLARPAGP